MNASNLSHAPIDGEIVRYFVPGSNGNNNAFTMPSIVPFGSSPSGTMTIRLSSPLPAISGLASTTYTTIEIHYNMSSGIQISPYHTNAGQSYRGTTRVAYLYNNQENHHLLTRFKIAFAYGYIFTIGTSVTKGQPNQITWSVIPHKTSLTGGTYGYPDPSYIINANQILDSIGIPSSSACLLYYHKTILPQSPPSNGVAVAAAAVGTSSALTPPSQITPPPQQQHSAKIQRKQQPSQSRKASSQRHDNPDETIPYSAPLSLLSDHYSTLLNNVLSNVTKDDVDTIISSKQHCALCLEDLIAPSHHHPKDSSTAAANLRTIRQCLHIFHKDCIEDCLKHHPKCPVCRKPIHEPQGKSPSGTMEIKLHRDMKCPGYPQADGTYMITYAIPSGIQSSYHDHPGTRYHGTQRVAYLPNILEGYQILQRFKYAWTHGLIFTIGTSLTNHTPHQTTWASIHHKTHLNYQYPHQQVAHSFPDDSYFYNVHESLDALHVPSYDEISEGPTTKS